MSIEAVPGSDLRYYLLSFDSAGHERRDDTGGLMSAQLKALLAKEQITDVFLMSHGWKGDVPAARAQYRQWIGAFADCEADRQRMLEVHPKFEPLIVGVHWPSLPFGDEELGAGEVSFGATSEGTSAGSPISVDRWVDLYAERLSDTPAARLALKTIFLAAVNDVAPVALPPQVIDAYVTLNREAGLGGSGPGGAPGADRQPFDPVTAYALAEESEAVSFGRGGFGGLLAPLQQLSFWKMKDRGCRIGETSGFDLLVNLQRACPSDRSVRFHLMGHSFGCIVVSAAIAGSRAHRALVRPVDTLYLVQGALSLWSYAKEIPGAPDESGYFRSVVADKKVAGPILATQSEHDTAVGTMYPIAAGVASQVEYAPSELPVYGAVGAFGLRGLEVASADISMLPADGRYDFSKAKVFNLESSAHICEGSGASGAHSDIAKPAVAHAFWDAVTSHYAAPR